MRTLGFDRGCADVLVIDCTPLDTIQRAASSYAGPSLLTHFHLLSPRRCTNCGDMLVIQFVNIIYQRYKRYDLSSIHENGHSLRMRITIALKLLVSVHLVRRLQHILYPSGVCARSYLYLPAFDGPPTERLHPFVPKATWKCLHFVHTATAGVIAAFLLSFCEPYSS